MTFLAVGMLAALPVLALAQGVVPGEPASPQTGQAAATPGLPQVSLSEQIAGLLGAPAVARDHWGIQVTMLDGTPLYSLNEAQLFQPASNAKLFTTAAALALLGPDKRFETEILGELDRTTGRVMGDLILHGAGDANFDSRDIPYTAPGSRARNLPYTPNPLSDLRDLVSQLVAKGVRTVDGDIVGDDSLFPYDPYPPDWSMDDAEWGYGAPVSALTIADNELRLTVTAAAEPDRLASVELEQAVSYYTIESSVRTVATKAEAIGVSVVRRPGSRTLLVSGSVAAGSDADVEEVAISDPAEYAAMALKAALLEAGIAVKGSAQAKHGYTFADPEITRHIQDSVGDEVDTMTGRGPVLIDCYLDSLPDAKVSTLATHVSSLLSDDVTYTNKVSQNLHAELLLRQVGDMGRLCGNGSDETGARIRREFLTSVAGLDAHDFMLYDGSGLSSHDLVTPRAIAKLLSYAAQDPNTGKPQPWFAAWKASLPVAGEDGTLAARFPDPPLKDHVFAKTGTLGEARALSGYLDAASGRTVIFSILDGNHLPGDSSDRDVMDKIVAAIQQSE